MEKGRIISQLVLLDTSEFRHRSFIKNGKYKHEPARYQLELMEIYNKLSEDNLQKLLVLRTK